MNVLNTKAGAIGVAVLVGGALLYFGAKKAAGAVGDAAKAVGGAVNPNSDKNVFYTGVNALGSTLTGDKSFTLGGWLYDVTNPDIPP